MDKPLDWQQLNAFVDGELDLNGQLAVESRLREDTALRAQVDELRGGSAALRERADYHAAPAALRARLFGNAPGRVARSAAAVPPTAPIAAPVWPRPHGRRDALAQWLPWRPLLVSFSVLALAAAMLLADFSGRQRLARLEQEVIGSHVRATLSQRLVDVSSSDHHAVKPWLSSKLDFSPPVSELNMSGASLLGGRLDYLDGRPVAALVYRQGQHVIDAFTWPAAEGDQALETRTVRGFQLAHWSRGGMTHWVISDLSREEFARIVRAIDLTATPP